VEGLWKSLALAHCACGSSRSTQKNELIAAVALQAHVQAHQFAVCCVYVRPDKRVMDKSDLLHWILCNIVLFWAFFSV
jgi:hypothetical protein